MTAPTMDQKLGETVYIHFTTNAADGSELAPTVQGTVRVFEAASGTAVATDADADVTYTPNFGGLSGYHLIAIDTSNDRYLAETNYRVVVSGMTVDTIANVQVAAGNFNLRVASLDDIYGSVFHEDQWRWDTDVTATDPGSGNVKADNAVYASITNIYVSTVSDSGSNGQLYFKNMTAGDQIIIADTKAPATNYIVAELTGPAVDNTGWFTMPVSILSSGGAIANNRMTLFGIRLTQQPSVISEADMEQIRHRLQTDGTRTAPAFSNPTFLPVDIQAIYADLNAPNTLSNTLKTMDFGTVGDDNAAPTLTEFDVILEYITATDNVLVGRGVVFTSANLQPIVRRITAHVSGRVTVDSALPSLPVVGNTIVII